MENIEDKIKDVLENEHIKFSKDTKYIELKEYFDEMKSKGLLQPKTYNLPPLDTIGSRLYEMK
jgi:hypothetical protein